MPKTNKGFYNQNKLGNESKNITPDIPSYERLSLILGSHGEWDSKSHDLFEAELKSKLEMVYPKSVYIILEDASTFKEDDNTRINENIKKGYTPLESYYRNNYFFINEKLPNNLQLKNTIEKYKKNEKYRHSQLQVIDKYATYNKYRNKIKLYVEIGNEEEETEFSSKKDKLAELQKKYLYSKDIEKAMECTKDFLYSFVKLNISRHNRILKLSQHILSKDDCGSLILCLGSAHDTLIEEFDNLGINMTYDYSSRFEPNLNNDKNEILESENSLFNFLEYKLILNPSYVLSKKENEIILFETAIEQELYEKPIFYGLKFSNTKEFSKISYNITNRLFDDKVREDFKSLIKDFGIKTAIKILISNS